VATARVALHAFEIGIFFDPIVQEVIVHFGPIIAKHGQIQQ
jgi:hypothetical protein